MEASHQGLQGQQVLLHYCQNILYSLGLYDYFLANQFSEFILNTTYSYTCHNTACAHAAQGYDNLIAVNINKLDVSPVCLQSWSYLPLDNLLDKGNLLKVGKFFWCLGFFRRFQGPDIPENSLDFFLAFAATATGFCIISYLIHCCKMVFNCYLPYLLFSNIETFADKLAFFLNNLWNAPVIGNSSLKRF